MYREYSLVLFGLPLISWCPGNEFEPAAMYRQEYQEFTLDGPLAVR